MNTARFPNFIVIGALKCATTSMHSYLDTHPEITMSLYKELNFFVEDLNWKKGVKWYKSNFRKKGKAYGETSPNYTNYPMYPGVPERMYALVPNAKLIYIVRDPIERMVSEYIQYYSESLEHQPLEDALRNGMPDNHYISRSKYFMQLEQYLKFYPKSQIMIVDFDELRDQRTKTLQEVFKFLGVDASFKSKHFQKMLHRSQQKKRLHPHGRFFHRLIHRFVAPYLPYYIRDKGWFIYHPFSQNFERPNLSESLHQEIKKHLVDDVQNLRELTGHQFKHWSL